MSTSDMLLTTKLYIPRVRPHLAPRPRLIEQLNEGLQRPLILVSAPAGFGKTTLLGEWLQQSRLPVAWLSLDDQDNDLARFITYFIAALQSRQKNVGQAALAMLRTPKPPPIEIILTSLVNEIATMTDEVILVLDDYHVINTQAIHHAMIFLLDHLPPSLRLVILSRTDPSLPLARLRVRDQLTELRAADLRFTPEEIAYFFERVRGTTLSAIEVAALAARTEGWIAGLQLAALSLQGQAPERIHSFIMAFAGDHRYVLDYLGEEVLQRQPEAVQTFLLQTSILDRLCGPLCDAVLAPPQEKEPAERNSPWTGSGTGVEDGLPTSLASGQAMLERLEQANLFIIPLDDQRHWYRYHHLFADFLRKHLEQRQADQVAELHSRASLWYEQHGFMAEAISHALHPRDFERAAQLVEQAAQALLLRGEMTTLLSWLETLPDELVCSHPQLCIFHAWTLILAGQMTAAEQRLQEALRGKPEPTLLGQVAAIRAFVIILQGDIIQAAELSRQALEQLPEDEIFLRGIATLNLGISQVLSGELGMAEQTFKEVTRISQRSGNITVAAIAISQVAEMQMAQGHLQQAAETYRQALALSTTTQGQPLPGAGLAYMGLGALLYEWNDLEAAAHYLDQGFNLSQQLGEVGVVDGSVALVRLKQAQGHETEALVLLKHVEQVMHQIGHLGDMLLTTHRVRLWLAQGHLAEATQWAIQVSRPSLETLSAPSQVRAENQIRSTPPYLLHELEQLTLIRVFIAQQRANRSHSSLPEVLQLLEALRESAQGLGRWGSVIEILLLQAMAYHAWGNMPQAILALEEALTLAEPGGYIRLFINEGAPMAELLSALNRQSSTVNKAYLARLLEAFSEIDTPLEKPEPPALYEKSKTQNFIDPLSERELEVLRLIAAGRSNEQIAQELIIAVGTVKKHINNIYNKLDVHSRTQALVRAKELNLL